MENNKVFIVSYDHDYNNWDIKAVFHKEEDAEKYIRDEVGKPELEPSEFDDNWYKIEEFEVR